jgi:hypothetical protein
VTIRRVLLVILHQLLCPYILVALTSLLTFCICGVFDGTVATARMLLFATPFYPIQIGMALVAGYLVTRYFNLPLARWMWVLPAALLLSQVLFRQLPDDVSRWGYWFGRFGMVGHVYPPLQVGVTMPFYTSAVYSLAAAVALRHKHLTTREFSGVSV